MVHALAAKGYHGVGLNELLSNAEAPKGVLYHHFPGGKSELATAAIETVAAELLIKLRRVFDQQKDVGDALEAWVREAEKRLSVSGYAAGCPLATIALESACEDVEIRDALNRAFVSIRSVLAEQLRHRGVDPRRAESLSALIVSAYEGALIQARVAGSVGALRDTSAMLVELARASIPDAAHSSRQL